MIMSAHNITAVGVPMPITAHSRTTYKLSVSS